MKKLNLVLVLMLSLASISILFFGASMRGQSSPALLLYTRFDGESRSLYLWDATSGVEQSLSPLASDADMDAGWSPDGRVWLMDSLVENTRRLRFFEPETGAESLFADDLYLDPCRPSFFWSPTGAQLAYLIGEADELAFKIVTMADGSSYQVAVKLGEELYWSPDANYVLIRHQYSDEPARLLSAANGSEIQTFSEFSFFSPDSRYLRYRDENEVAFLYELATGESIELGENWYFGTWSPSGRYLMKRNNPLSQQLSYYDAQMGELTTIDFAYPINFAAWTADENTVLLTADYQEYFRDERPSRLFAYHLLEATSRPILENTGWIGNILKSGDWLAIPYSSVPPTEYRSPTNQVLFLSASESITAELTIDIPESITNIAGLGNDWGFLLRADTGLYRFDNATAQLLSLEAAPTSMPFWTADGSYLAFMSMNEAGELAHLSILDATGTRTDIVQDSAYPIEILGWQGSEIQKRLLYCGER